MNVDMKTEAQWGFLKNIVNIDTFFSSGALSEARPLKERPVVKEMKEEKVIPVVEKIKPIPKKTIDETDEVDDEIDEVDEAIKMKK